MKKQKRDSSLKFVLALSLLCSFGIVLGKFLAFNITEFMRFSLENLTIIFSAVAFGPLAGLTVGVVQDVVGCIAAGYLLNPIITLGSGLVGLVAGVVYLTSKKAPGLLRITLTVALAHLVGSVLLKTLGLAIYYSLPFGVTLAWRLLNYAIVGTLEIILLIYLTKSKLLLSKIEEIKPKRQNKKGDSK